FGDFCDQLCAVQPDTRPSEQLCCSAVGIVLKTLATVFEILVDGLGFPPVGAIDMRVAPRGACVAIGTHSAASMMEGGAGALFSVGRRSARVGGLFATLASTAAREKAFQRSNLGPFGRSTTVSCAPWPTDVIRKATFSPR